MDKDIERYIFHEMSEEERKTFEEMLEQDDNLKLQLEEGILLKNAVAEVARKDIKARLKKRELAISSKSNNTIWIVGAGMLVLLTVVGLFYKSYDTNSPKTPEIEIEPKKETSIPPLETIELEKNQAIKENPENPQKPQNKEIQKKPEKRVESGGGFANNNKTPSTKGSLDKPNEPSSEELYAMAYEAYRHPSLNPGTRSSGEMSARQKYEQAYWDENYDEVLVLFDQLSDTQKESGNLLFLKAISLMEAERFEEAHEILDRLTKMDRHRFKEESKKYLQLCELRF